MAISLRHRRHRLTRGKIVDESMPKARRQQQTETPIQKAPRRSARIFRSDVVGDRPMIKKLVTAIAKLMSCSSRFQLISATRWAVMGWRRGDVSRTCLASKCRRPRYERYRWAITCPAVYGRLGRAAIPPAVVQRLRERWPRFVPASADGRCAAMAAARARPGQLVGSRLPHNLAIAAHDIAEVFWRSSMLGESPRPPTLARAAPGKAKIKRPDRAGDRRDKARPTTAVCTPAAVRRRRESAGGEEAGPPQVTVLSTCVALVLQHAWRWFCSTRGAGSAARVALVLPARAAFCSRRKRRRVPGLARAVWRLFSVEFGRCPRRNGGASQPAPIPGLV